MKHDWEESDRTSISSSLFAAIGILAGAALCATIVYVALRAASF